MCLGCRRALMTSRPLPSMEPVEPTSAKMKERTCSGERFILTVTMREVKKAIREYVHLANLGEVCPNCLLCAIAIYNGRLHRVLHLLLRATVQDAKNAIRKLRALRAPTKSSKSLPPRKNNRVLLQEGLAFSQVTPRLQINERAGNENCNRVTTCGCSGRCARLLCLCAFLCGLRRGLLCLFGGLCSLLLLGLLLLLTKVKRRSSLKHGKKSSSTTTRQSAKCTSALSSVATCGCES